ncbi:MAG: ribosome small subunit-dependent GTPase A [Desulforhopalus sp.]
MNTRYITDNQEEKNVLPSLRQLGWSSFFKDQLGDSFPEQLPAKIIGVRKNLFLAKQGQHEITATAAGKLFNSPEPAVPVVGDWVVLRDSLIIAVLTRKNTLLRRASGARDRKESGKGADQIIAANLDMVFIVCGLDRDFNLRRIERYLTLVYNCGLSPVIILTKSDLCPAPELMVSEVETISCGVPVYTVSLHDETSLGEIASLLSPDKSAALLGSSGAGKSTLINRLAGAEVRITGMVGTRVGKGKHTTTTRDLILLPSGGMVIDNPGIREVGLATDGEGSMEIFPDIEAIARSCRFKDCSHSHEPGCRVLQAVRDRVISADRLKNYHKIKNEISYTLQRQRKSASRIEKERWREVSQKAKSIKKRREQCK